MRSFRSLLPSLLLIAIYFVAEEFFKSTISLFVIIILGSGELIYQRIRYKQTDKFTLWTTLAFVVLGVVGIYIEGGAIERLRSPIIEAVLSIMLGVFAFTKIDLSMSLPESQRQKLHITSEQQQIMHNMLKWLFLLISLHTLLAFYAAFRLTDSQYNFISGAMLYILIVAFFLFIIVKNRITIHLLKRAEWLPIVNEKGEITGRATLKSCYSNGYLHPVVHIHITKPNGDIYLQKRDIKNRVLPDRWDTFITGDVDFGESIEEALKRKTFEKLGITEFKARFLGKYIWNEEYSLNLFQSKHLRKCQQKRELIFTFLCTPYTPIKINTDANKGRFWSKQAIEDPVNQDLFTPVFLNEYHTILKKQL